MANGPSVDGEIHSTLSIHSSKLSFGSYILDLRSGELTSDGKRVYLQRQPLEVLRLLLRNPGEMVSREELRDHLWPSDTFVDFDHGLNKAVQKLRTVLSDRSDRPQFIETVPRRGYRFIAQVREVETPIADALPEPDLLISRKLPRQRIVLAIAAAAMAFALLFYIGYRTFSSEPVARVERLAVLPFQNSSGDPDQEYLTDGITEELIGRLSQYSPARLAVVSRTSAMAYKHSNKTPSTIGSELNAQYVIEGGVQRSGDRVHVTAKLIHVRSQTQLWAKTYDREMDDIFSLQKNVGEDVAREIGLKLTPAGSNSQHSYVNPEAYEAFLRGLYRWHTGPADSPETLQYFKQAISLQPDYALAYAWLAFSYNRLGSGEVIPPKEAFPLAKQAALKAIELDPNLPEAHAAMGFVLRNYEWDWNGSDSELQQALRVDPNSPLANHVYGLYLSTVGRHDEAIAVLEKTADLDPLSPTVVSNRGMIYANARKYSEAIAARQRYVDLLGKDPIWWGHFLLARGANKQALTYFESAPQSATALAGRAQAYAAMGKTSEARALLKQLKSHPSARSILSPYIARVHAALGETDEAFHWLDIACQEHAARLIFLKVDPAWDLLRGDPRFQDLLHRMNLLS